MINIDPPCRFRIPEDRHWAISVDEIKAVDRVMVGWGNILAQRQFDKQYAPDKISRAAQNIRRMP